MKKLLLLMLLTFTTMTFAAEEDLSFPFTPDSGKYWRYISDRAMGGVSDGQANLERDGEVFLQGSQAMQAQGIMVVLFNFVQEYHLLTLKKMAKKLKVFV